MFKQKREWFFVFLLLSLPFLAHASTALVEWTFPEVSADAIADGGIADNITEKILVVGANTPIKFTSSQSAGTLSAWTEGWKDGVDQKYWQIKFGSLGYTDLVLFSQQRSSGTGPRDFVIEYRLDENDSWKSIPDNTIEVGSVFSDTKKILFLPEETFDQPSVFVRFVMNTNASVNNSTVATGGSSNIDNIIVTGKAIGDSEDEDPMDVLCVGDKTRISLNELLPYPPTGNEEYVELYNQGDECVSLASWRIEDAGNHKYIFPSDAIIEGGSYISLSRNFYLNNGSSESLVLYDAENIERSRVFYEQPLAGFSYSFNGNEWLFTSTLTPGAENIFDEEETSEDETEEPAPQAEAVILNEILPNPVGDETAGEYIELFNPSEQTVALKDWLLRDTSRTRLVFDREAIPPKEYLALPRSVFKFSLNNTGAETVTLLRPDGTVASTLSYADAKENFSYNFDGEDYRWSSILTPGTENQFSKEPKIHIESKQSGFVDFPLPFQASLQKKHKTKNDKYLWQFDDGHQSRVAKPKHTYEKTGKYDVTVTIKNEKVEASKTFTVHISKYPKEKVAIIRLLPNPKGKDTDAEWIEVQNLSPKPLSLKDWKIATGSDPENLRNHNFTKEVIIPASSSYKITGLENTFALNNTSSIVELRYPNNTTASQTMYDEEKINDDAVCYNLNGICDFEGKPSENKEDGTDGEVLGEAAEVPKETPTDSGENNVETIAPLTTKQELKKRIKEDINALMSIYFMEWFSH